MSDVGPAYEQANKVIGDAQEAYLKTVSTFKANIKNDLSSISAAAQKIQAESAKVRAAYEDTARQLITADMERAIVNAERLAVALKTISELQSNRITLAVLDSKPKDGQ